MPPLHARTPGGWTCPPPHPAPTRLHRSPSLFHHALLSSRPATRRVPCRRRPHRSCADALESWRAARHGEAGRLFEHADGTPFFWLADTAWLITQKLNREEVKTYFEDRRAKGFNVVQCCVVQFPHDKSFNGSPALVGNDISRLNLTPGSDPAIRAV